MLRKIAVEVNKGIKVFGIPIRNMEINMSELKKQG